MVTKYKNYKTDKQCSQTWQSTDFLLKACRRALSYSILHVVVLCTCCPIMNRTFEFSGTLFQMFHAVSSNCFTQMSEKYGLEITSAQQYLASQLAHNIF